VYAGDVGLYAGDVGLYCGDVGLYCGDVGLYCGDVGLYVGLVGLYVGDVGLQAHATTNMQVSNRGKHKQLLTRKASAEAKAGFLQAPSQQALYAVLLTHNYCVVSKRTCT
jgi:hypothetical protein